VPIWQNVLDLWTIQETIAEVKPALLIETGTSRRGSAMFYAHLMELLGTGRVITVDIVDKRDGLSHPRITFLEGSSTDSEIVAQLREAAADADGAVMVILDGDHSKDHVAEELDLYAPLVTPWSFLLSQDGVIDTVWMFRDSRPGPLRANRSFLERHPGSNTTASATSASD
jgi:cephalosporin hydroxylase